MLDLCLVNLPSGKMVKQLHARTDYVSGKLRTPIDCRPRFVRGARPLTAEHQQLADGL